MLPTCVAVVVVALLLATVPARSGPTTVALPTADATTPTSTRPTLTAGSGRAARTDPASDLPVQPTTEEPIAEQRALPVRLSPPTVRAPAAPAARATASDAPASEPGRAATLPRSEPTRVRIAAIGVDASLMGLGLHPDGSMEVPPGAFPAGWYTGAPTPGELGPAILAGHVDLGGRAGVFFRLREVRTGDRVQVARADGSTAVFVVTRVEQHPKDAFPTAAVYGDIDHAGLRLITCGGSFDRRARSYRDNIVVFAELVPGASEAGG